MTTFRDFDSREEFVRHLNLWHYDKNSNKPEYTVIGQATGFQDELIDIKNNLEVIKTKWNNQSIDQIEKSVSADGSKQLEIMQGQKNDKLKAGYHPEQPMYRIHACPSHSVFYQLAKSLGLDSAYVRYHVQFPGEVTVFHTDIFSPSHEFLPNFGTNKDDLLVGKDNGIRRVIIAMEDWDWGQVFHFGSTGWTQWRSGDIIYWDFGVPHCTANMGYVPRISASITGLATNKFYQKINHAR
jgi:hypothetical protein